MKNRQLAWKYIIWILAYPLYQIIGTIRHESAHALWAYYEGATITDFRVLPSIIQGRWYWGYVRWIGQVSWLGTVAPYILDLLTVICGVIILYYIRQQKTWLWINILIIFIISPFANSIYNYGNALLLHKGDVEKLFTILPNYTVHLYFIITLTAYVTALWWIVKLRSSLFSNLINHNNKS